MGQCSSPIPAWRRAEPDENGKFPLVFNPKDKQAGEELELPCGQCIHCRLNYARDWAVRCMHEAQMHQEQGNESSFITLTYNDEEIPTNWSLQPDHWTKFIKRLREKIRHEQPELRFFMAGEYGKACRICRQSEDDCRNYSRHQFVEGLGRPHFHAILFGYNFPDKTLWRTSNGHEIFRSELLEDTWTYGNSEIGSVTFDSASYVARYITKKITGEQSNEHYLDIDPYTGEYISRLPEYCRQSRGRGWKTGTIITSGGIGSGWFRKYYGDTHDDICHIEGKPHPIPAYYDSILERIDYDEYNHRKDRRRHRDKEREHADRKQVRSDLARHRLNRNNRQLI